MHVSWIISANNWSLDLIFGAKRILSSRRSRWCPHFDEIPNFRDPTARNVFIRLPCAFFSKGGPMAVQPRAVRPVARDLDIRTRREILG